jgi:anti-sigma B factor antagonist
MTTDELAGTFVLEVRGELDLATAPELCHEIESASAEGRQIVIDLCGVTTCDTSSLRALVGAIQESTIRMCDVAVAVTPGTALDRLLDLTGTREFLRAEPKRSAAVSAVS